MGETIYEMRVKVKKEKFDMVAGLIMRLASSPNISQNVQLRALAGSRIVADPQASIVTISGICRNMWEVEELERSFQDSSPIEWVKFTVQKPMED